MKADGNGVVRLATRDWVWVITVVALGVFSVASLHFTGMSRLTQKISGIELRLVERIGKLRTDILAEVPPPDVLRRLSELERRMDRVENSVGGA